MQRLASPEYGGDIDSEKLTLRRTSSMDCTV